MSYDEKKIQLLDSALRDAGVDHFYANEMGRLDNGQWDGDRRQLPAKQYLTRIVPAAQLADQVRKIWGDAVTVGSGFRPPAYNELVGGSPGSKHKEFRALDIYPSTYPEFDLERFFAIVRGVIAGARLAGWNVGLGLYYDRPGNKNDRFAHIDVGASPRNRAWVEPEAKSAQLARVGL